MLFLFLYSAIFVVCIAAVHWCFTPLISSWWADRSPSSAQHPSEACFTDPNSPTGKGTFPSLLSLPTDTDADSDSDSLIDLSVIVPAYNEQDRLPGMLDEALTYLSRRSSAAGPMAKPFRFEIIIVDDGSKDQTSKVVLEYTHKYGSNCVRLLRLVTNRGKGGAVKRGMMAARGKYLLFADADAATVFEDVERLERGMRAIETVDGQGIVVGSRAHLEDKALASRSFIRTVLMHGFHFVVATLCVRDIRDTQCGFKLFTRAAARRMFVNQHIERWAFDAELLFIASRMGIPVREEAVNWTEIAGSKLSVASATIQMLRDLILIRLCYTVGVWKVLEPEVIAKLKNERLAGSKLK